VAVGYGQFEYVKQDSGLLCCWSLKNPEASAGFTLFCRECIRLHFQI